MSKQYNVPKDPKHSPTAEQTLAVWKQPVNNFAKKTGASSFLFPVIHD